MLMKLCRVFTSIFVITLFGCGGGGGDEGTTVPVQPTRAVVKVRTTGTLPGNTAIGGIEATVTYPTNKGLSITSGDVTASGAGAGSLLVANVAEAGQVHLALANANGIQVGEFATLTFSIAAGNTPVAADFAVAAGARVIDTSGAAIPGITVEILNITFQ